MEKRAAGMYGFDIESERRREAGFKEEIRRRWVAGIIAALSFRVAKTMPERPHENVVRTPENEAAYVALFKLIIEHGVHEMWRGRRYQYWYPGDGWKYWRMNDDIGQSQVLNRACADTPIAGRQGGIRGHERNRERRPQRH